MTFTKENIELLKNNCQQIIQLLNENVDGAFMHSQLMCLGERLKDFGKNPIVKNSGILLLNETPISDINVSFNTEPSICREDILEVAKRLKMKEPSEEIIQEIIEEHEGACENDPSATWDLVVEAQLYAKIS